MSFGSRRHILGYGDRFFSLKGDLLKGQNPKVFLGLFWPKIPDFSGSTHLGASEMILNGVFYRETTYSRRKNRNSVIFSAFLPKNTVFALIVYFIPKNPNFWRFLGIHLCEFCFARVFRCLLGPEDTSSAENSKFENLVMFSMFYWEIKNKCNSSVIWVFQ